MKARCTSCGREAFFRTPRGFRLEFQRCSCGGSYSRVNERPDLRPCQGDAWTPAYPRARAASCHSCARFEARGGKCAGRTLRMLTAEEQEAYYAELEARLREEVCRDSH